MEMPISIYGQKLFFFMSDIVFPTVAELEQLRQLLYKAEVQKLELNPSERAELRRLVAITYSERFVRKKSLPELIRQGIILLGLGISYQRKMNGHDTYYPSISSEYLRYGIPACPAILCSSCSYFTCWRIDSIMLIFARR
jgi:hypothetical protein